MEETTIAKIKPGEFFTRRKIEEPKMEQVWVRDIYDRSSGRILAWKFSDPTDSKMFKPDTKVYIGFTF